MSEPKCELCDEETAEYRAVVRVLSEDGEPVAFPAAPGWPGVPGFEPVDHELIVCARCAKSPAFARHCVSYSADLDVAEGDLTEAMLGGGEPVVPRMLPEDLQVVNRSKYPLHIQGLVTDDGKVSIVIEEAGEQPEVRAVFGVRQPRERGEGA